MNEPFVTEQGMFVPPAPTPNLPLLRKVLDHIDAHPEEWHQRYFAPRVGEGCGTTFCIAGHAVQMTIGTRVLPDAPFGAYAVEPTNGASWTTAGRDVLRLTNDEALDLFSAVNDRARVQIVAERIAARAGERL